MLPLYNNAKANQKIHKYSKKWDKYFRTMRHETTLSSLLIVLIFISLFSFTIYYYSSIFFSPSPPITPTPAIPTEAPSEEKEPQQPINMNIVSTKEKETKQIEVEVKDESKERRERVKAAFVHAYGGYIQYAFGSDELRPGISSSPYLLSFNE